MAFEFFFKFMCDLTEDCTHAKIIQIAGVHVSAKKYPRADCVYLLFSHIMTYTFICVERFFYFSHLYATDVSKVLWTGSSR